jgi:hypothetical protein
MNFYDLSNVKTMTFLELVHIFHSKAFCERLLCEFVPFPGFIWQPT